MLAMRNKDGEIFGSVGGLAHAARIPLDTTAAAIGKFLRPEPDSSSGDDGRRIEVIPGGWRLLNHERIRAEAEAASKNAYMASYMRRKRAIEKLLKVIPPEVAEKYRNAVAAGADEAALALILQPYAKTKKWRPPMVKTAAEKAEEDK